MNLIWTVIITILVFSFLIFFHELGHFIAAKLSKIDVLEFAIGMGPALFKKEKNGTLYAVRAFPIGGYCKMEGEEENSEKEGSFSSKPLYSRFFVVVAGSLMNFIAGFLILIVMICMTQVVGSTEVVKFKDTTSPSPSQAAGLMIGDKIIKMNNTDINISDDIVFFLTTNGDEPVDITVLRNGQKITISGVMFPYEAVDKSQITGSAQDKGQTKKMVYSDFYVKAQNITPGLVIQQAFYKSISIAKLVWVSLVDLVRGKVGVSELSGPIGVGNAIGTASAAGIYSLLYIVVFITINLGVINLLPLPALDGGRIVFLLFELVTRHRVKPERENVVHFIGLVLFILLAVFVAYQDILKLVIK